MCGMPSLSRAISTGAPRPRTRTSPSSCGSDWRRYSQPAAPSARTSTTTAMKMLRASLKLLLSTPREIDLLGGHERSALVFFDARVGRRFLAREDFGREAFRIVHRLVPQARRIRVVVPRA